MAWSALDHMVIRSFLFSVSIAHSLALGRALKRSWARMPSYPFLPFLLVELYMIKLSFHLPQETLYPSPYRHLRRLHRSICPGRFSTGAGAR
jgi:hypothetical protein